MKRAWRCLVGWLLVGLIVLQLPMTALADEIVPVEVEEAAEPSLSEAETGQIDEDDPVIDDDLPIDSAEDSAVPSEEEPAADTDARKRRLGSSSGPAAVLALSSGFAAFAVADALSAITWGARRRSHFRRSSSWR